VWLQHNFVSAEASDSVSAETRAPKEIMLDRQLHYILSARTVLTFDADTNNLYLCSYHSDAEDKIQCSSYFYIYRPTDREEPLVNLLSVRRECDAITLETLYRSEMLDSKEEQVSFYKIKIFRPSREKYQYGLWLTTHEDGSLQEKGNYANGKKRGYVSEYYADGKILSVGYYDDVGLKEGEFTIGTITEYTDYVVFVDDVRNGTFSRVQDSTDEVVERGYYTDGEKSGV